MEISKPMDVVKTEAEIAKLMAETAKINAEARWYPYALAVASFGGVAAVLKLFFA